MVRYHARLIRDRYGVILQIDANSFLVLLGHPAVWAISKTTMICGGHALFREASARLTGPKGHDSGFALKPN
jgi:hypothetical protein